jgi:shikimate kinase
MHRNIVLIGFMGSGKSTLAKILNKDLGWEVVSTDDFIQQSEGKRIADIFKEFGEKYFRELEHRVVMELSLRQKLIIDCGGGVVLNQDNIQALKRNGTIFYLTCQAEEIYRRVQMQPKRPLLDVPDPLLKIKELLMIRQPYYEQADVTLDTTDGDLHRVALELLKYVNKQ